MLRAAKSVLSSAALAALTGLGTAAVAPAQSAQPQTFSTLAIKADVVLSPEFCATTMKKGSVWTVKESFAVGENTCPKLETELAKIFTGLSRISKLPEPNDGAADIILVPKFGDIGATMAVGAFSNRELVVVLEWTALDRAGKTLWVQTVQGSARKHMGNAFTHGKNMRKITEATVDDLVEKSATQISSAPELRKLSSK
jgi:hypothetical protein